MKFNRGVLYALISATTAGIAIVNDTFMLKHVDTLSYLVIGFFSSRSFHFFDATENCEENETTISARTFEKKCYFTFVYTIAGILFYSQSLAVEKLHK